ncbi:unnamed protein product [Allacma fusca]|uniref:Uncharacterized protein n=1 Tax=Allacma fusca TaxID=39272 RepID=A0A8J2LLA9_9HEXA|nr:unnamed protein product [Allacma fusca]
MTLPLKFFPVIFFTIIVPVYPTFGDENHFRRGVSETLDRQNYPGSRRSNTCTPHILFNEEDSEIYSGIISAISTKGQIRRSPMYISGFAQLPEKILTSKHLRKSQVLKHLRSCEIFLVDVANLKIYEEKNIHKKREEECYQKLVLFGAPSVDIFIFLDDFAQKPEYNLDTSLLKLLKWKFYADYGSVGHKMNPEETMRPGNTREICQVSDVEVPRSRINLNGVSLKVSGIVLPPYMILDKGSGKIMGGTFCLLFEVVSKYYNFSYDMSTDPKPTGSLLPNGSWTGMMGDIYHGKKDIGMCIHVTSSRYEHLDYTTYMFTEQALFLLAHPVTNVKWNALISPFTPQVWFYFMTSFFLMVLVFYLVFKTGDLYPVNNNCKYSKEKTSEIVYQAFMHPFRIAIDQDSVVPKRGRILTGFWLLFVLVLSTGYKDKLVSFLTFPEPDPIPRNLKEVHRRPDFKMIFHFWGSTMLDRFQNKHNSMMLSLGKRLVLEKDAATCVVNATLNQKTLCLGVRSFLSLAMAKNVTLSSAFQTYQLSEGLFFPIYLSFPLPKNSIYTAAWDRIAGMFRESGLLPKLNQDVFREFKKQGREWILKDHNSGIYRSLLNTMRSQDESEKPLAFKHFLMVFAFLTLCYIACAFLWLGEVLRMSQLSLHSYLPAHFLFATTLPQAFY